MAVAPQNYAGTVTLNDSKYDCYLRASETYVSNGSDNYSDVSVELHIVRTGWGWSSGAYGGTLYISGTPYDFSYTPNWSFGSSGDVIVGSATKRVYHDNDGRKSVSVAGYWVTTGTYSCGTANVVDNTYVLSDIPRYTSITNYTLTGKTDTSVIVTWGAANTCDIVQHSVNSGAWTTGYSGSATSGSYTINGLSPGTYYDIKIRVRRADSGLYTDSGSIAVTTYGYATINSFSVASRTLTSVALTYSVNVAIDYVQHRVNGGAWVDNVTATGLTPNTTYNFEIRVRRTDSQLWTLSSVIQGTTYDYARITGANNVNDEQNPYMTFSNVYGSAINAYIEILNPTTTVATRLDISNTGNYSFVLSSGEKTTLYNKCGANSETTIRYVLVTKVNGVNTYWSILDRTFSIVNDNPTFSNFTYADTNATTLALTGNNQNSIGKYSNIAITVSSANKMVAQKGATATKYTAISNSNSIDITYGTGNVTGTINNSNSNVLNVYAKDNRNNQTVVTKSITNIAYTETIINSMAFLRKDGVGSSVLIVGTGTYDTVNFGASANTITSVEYRRKIGAGAWGSWINITGYFDITGGNCTNKTVNELAATTWTLGTEYDVEVKFVDKLSTYTKSLIVDSGKVLMSALKDNGVCLGGIYDKAVSGALQVLGKQIILGSASDENFITRAIQGSDGVGGLGDLYLNYGNTNKVYINNNINLFLMAYPVGAIYMSVVSTSPATLFGGTWTALQNSFLIGAGGTYSVNATGGSATHTLTSAEMPIHTHTQNAHTHIQDAHNHTVKGTGISGTDSCYSRVEATAAWESSKITSATATNQNTTATNNTAGSGSAHNNMPPYLAVFMWKRVS